jgi:hypothetical protein
MAFTFEAVSRAGGANGLLTLRRTDTSTLAEVTIDLPYDMGSGGLFAVHEGTGAAWFYLYAGAFDPGILVFTTTDFTLKFDATVTGAAYINLMYSSAGFTTPGDYIVFASSGNLGWKSQYSNVLLISAEDGTLLKEGDDTLPGWPVEDVDPACPPFWTAFKQTIEVDLCDPVDPVDPGTDFDLSAVTYDNVSLNVAFENPRPYEVTFSSDGTKMFVVASLDPNIYQYTLNTAFDFSTGVTYDSVSFNATPQDARPTAVAFSNGGTKMFVLGDNSNRIHQYTLTTGFDVDTAIYDSASFDPTPQELAPFDLAFSSDGTKMFVLGQISGRVHQYTLTTEFDVSTASYGGTSFDPTPQDSAPVTFAFSSDGTRMAVVGGNTGVIHQYTLSTGFDVGTASYDGTSFNPAAQDFIPYGVTFSNDGTKMFMAGFASGRIYQYTLN